MIKQLINNERKICSTLNRIATENDFKAMNFAIKEKFCDVKNRYDETNYDRSIKECHFHLVHLIIEFRWSNDYSNIIPRDFYILRFILKIQYFDVNGALIYASRNDHHEVVKLLLTVPGIDVNTKDNFKYTALIYASEYGHREIVKMLLAVPGIDVNAKTIDNYTALILASRNDHHEVVKLLLE